MRSGLSGEMSPHVRRQINNIQGAWSDLRALAGQK